MLEGIWGYVGGYVWEYVFGMLRYCGELLEGVFGTCLGITTSINDMILYYHFVVTVNRSFRQFSLSPGLGGRICLFLTAGLASRI